MELFPVLGKLVTSPFGTGRSSTDGCSGEGTNPMPYLSRGPRIFAGLCEDYIASPVFRNLAPNSQRLWEREIRQAGSLEELGSYSLKQIAPHLISNYLQSLTGRPGKQAAALSALRALEAWALSRNLLPHPICYRVKTERPQGGHKPWNDQQVAIAIRNSRADIGRAIVLGAYTGQRGSDLVRMGWGDILLVKGRSWIKLRQQKTGREFMIPVTEELAGHLQTWERLPGPFLRRLDGRLWEREALTKAWYYERDTNPALREHRTQNLHLHGLRAYACVRLYLAGANTRQVAQTVGMSEDMVARYTRLSSQLDEAEAAIEMLERNKNRR